MHILHVLNYAWPYIDGYTVRSMGLTTAQQRHLGLRVTVATSPYAPFAKGSDPAFVLPEWGPGNQIRALSHAPGDQHEGKLKRLERPSMGLAPWTGPMFRRELDSIIERLQPDIVHAHHPHFIGAVAQALAARRGLPFVYEVRCFNGDYDLDGRHPYYLLRGRYQNELEMRIARRADAVVTISDGLARRLTDAGVPAERVFVVRNSVNSELFAPGTHQIVRRSTSPPQRQFATNEPVEAPSPQRRGGLGERSDASTGKSSPRAATSSNSGNSTLIVGYATTFEAIENLDVLVRAAGQARETLRQQGRDLRLVIAGTGRDWPRIDALVRDLSLSDMVDLPGFVPYGQMPDFYRGLDLFVVARGYATVAADTTPLKPLEALASGLPMLVSDLPAARELLGDKAGVRFFTPEVAPLAAAIVGFANEPWPSDASQIADRTWQREIERYTEVYAAARHNVRQGKAAKLSASPAGVPTNGSLPRRVAKQALRTIVDSGRLAPLGLQPLQKHVVVCGFPRAGSTLLQLMAQSCVDDVLTFSGEVEALWAARHANRRQRFLLTKLPSDAEQVDAIRAYYRRHPGDARFVFTLRDPRDVLTSTHKGYPDARGYYVSPERWRQVYELMQRYQHDRDVTILRYEALITQPGQVEQQMADAIGWTVTHAFARFHEVAAQRVARDSMTEGALGGLRPLDASGLRRWRQPQHAERLRELLSALPDLPQILVELGYEQDERWVETLLLDETEMAAAAITEDRPRHLDQRLPLVATDAQ